MTNASGALEINIQSHKREVTITMASGEIVKITNVDAVVIHHDVEGTVMFADLNRASLAHH